VFTLDKVNYTENLVNSVDASIDTAETWKAATRASNLSRPRLLNKMPTKMDSRIKDELDAVVAHGLGVPKS